MKHAVVSLCFNTYWYWYINLTIGGAIYPSQHFPFGVAFVCQDRNFRTHPRICEWSLCWTCRASGIFWCNMFCLCV